MAANLEDQLIDKVRALAPDKQQEALRLLDTLATSPSSEGTGVDRRPIWEVVDEINAGNRCTATHSGGLFLRKRTHFITGFE